MFAILHMFKDHLPIKFSQILWKFTMYGHAFHMVKGMYFQVTFNQEV